MRTLFDDEDTLVNKQVMSRQYVALQAGATARIMEYIQQTKPANVTQ